ncbi:MAG: ATP-dependent sacrificial sulfur transferase LarE [Deltaproteobacteria bacterium]|nr:ATP-dependent sacrificial sulfur transferase LarE [Deltaproteobacteria bacterium]
MLAKLGRLETRLESLGRVVVAFSGGVDSAFVLFVAVRVLGRRVVAMTARSPSMMEMEFEDAVRLASELGVRHEVVETRELERPGYIENSSQRCYHCKSELFDATSSWVTEAARAREASAVVDGFNADDLKDHRPGHRAASEHGVYHPLAEAGLTKREIRALSKHLGLRTWNKPQLACLASRFPYGMPVTEQGLRRVETVETWLRQRGFFDVRARLVKGNDDYVRVEIGEREMVRLLETRTRAALVEVARGAGFRFVTVDLEGFRSGRMNEGLGVRSGEKSGETSELASDSRLNAGWGRADDLVQLRTHVSSPTHALSPTHAPTPE